MRKFITSTVILSTLLFASNSDEEKSKKRAQEQLKIEMEKEKKYAKEQAFYTIENYDLKGSEVNKESLDSLPDLENQDDFDMDSVYD